MISADPLKASQQKLLTRVYNCIITRSSWSTDCTPLLADSEYSGRPQADYSGNPLGPALFVEALVG